MELAALEKRLTAESPEDETVKLADSLYDTKLSNGQEKVDCTPSHLHTCHHDSPVKTGARETLT